MPLDRDTLNAAVSGASELRHLVTGARPRTREALDRAVAAAEHWSVEHGHPAGVTYLAALCRQVARGDAPPGVSPDNVHPATDWRWSYLQGVTAADEPGLPTDDPTERLRRGVELAQAHATVAGGERSMMFLAGFAGRMSHQLEPRRHFVDLDPSGP